MKANKLPSLERLEELFDYDPCIGLLLYKKSGKEAGGFNKQLYRTVTVDGTKYYTHRIVWKMFYRKEPGCHLQIDHINGCPHDNSIDNLRRCKQRTNLRNSKASRRG